MNDRRIWIVVLVLSLGTMPGAANAASVAIDIDVVALFKDRAVLEINGEQQLLDVGETSKEGIRLISADSREAFIELGTETIRLDLTSRIGTQFEEAPEAMVSIALNEIGQYRTMGSINERPTWFVVDTGANVVAMNREIAESLGVDLRRGRQMQSITAGGPVRSWEVLLPQVEVGGIRVNNVRAAVLEGPFPVDVLLGMSFLGSVQMQESNGVLVLKRKL